jgi:hypothetical protein
MCDNKKLTEQFEELKRDSYKMALERNNLRVQLDNAVKGFGDKSFTAEMLEEAEEGGDEALEEYVKAKFEEALMNEEIFVRCE